MRQKLWAVVQDELGVLQLGISSACESMLKKFIDSGAAALEQAAALRRVSGQPASTALNADDATDFARAEANIRLLVQRMADDARNKGYSELHEDTFAFALSWFCPGFFPFC